jgi:HSP20 family protein
MNLARFFREMESLKNQFEGMVREFGFPEMPKNAFLSALSTSHFPMVNLSEDEQVYHLEAITPGVDPATLQVSAQRNSLTIAGEKTRSHAADAALHRSERGVGKFSRTITLPFEVDPDRITAEYRHGILHLTLPKPESDKPRLIQVSVK